MSSNRQQLSSTRHLVAIIVGIAITLVTGVAAGYFNQRWGPSATIEAYATQLATMPERIGDWQMIKESKMSEFEIQMLECREYINRQYRNGETGQQVSIAIMLGPTGPISVHTPEICYSSRDYDTKSDRQAVTIVESEDRTHNFWQVDFAASRPLHADLSVYYAWTDGGPWQAAKSPRFEFATSRALFKLQVASSDLTDLNASESDACRTFLKDLFHSGWTVASSGSTPQSDAGSTDG